LAAVLWSATTLATQPGEAAEAPSGEPELPAEVLEGLQSDLPALISADRVTYDETLGIVTASGKVEISQGARVLHAESVSYNLRNDIVTASGNVSLLEPDGEVVFADYVELTGDLREGFIKDIRVLLSDRSRMAADSGLRTAGNRTVFRRGVFSPCDLCPDDPSRPPLWQIKAGKIVHDQGDRTIRYSNAWLEFAGIPVLYTPYLEHPDPTVERRTGFLTPTFGSSDTLGGVVQVPYYWTFSPTLDATFEPIFTTNQGIVLAGEVRQLLPFGRHELNGSLTSADREEDDGTISKDVWRGHVDTAGRYDISETWRAGFDVDWTSDDTYLRLYNFDDSSFLTSNVFAEHLYGRDYGAANAFVFQGLRVTDVGREAPIVAPLLDYNFVSEPWIADSTYSFDANLMVLSRREGRDVRRVSLTGGWQVPYTDPIGGLYTLSTMLRADGYWSNDFLPGSNEVNPPGPSETVTAGRLFPQAALTWRYPWGRRSESLNQVIEPMAQLVVGLNDGNPDDIPNEDSLDFEFDDTNLFSVNRFPGLDRVDSGQRLDYGLQWKAIGANDGQAGFFIGQSYRLKREDDLFPENSGVRGKLSDVVGRVDLRPVNYFDLLYRFRLDKDDFSPSRNEIDLRLGPPALNLDLDYLFIDSTTGATRLGDREELRLRLSSRLNENWSGFVANRRDLERDDTLSTSIGLTYQDECFLIEVSGQRRFFSDREIDQDDSIFLQITFKGLGGFQSE
jgi:LPS-assembly protein